MLNSILRSLLISIPLLLSMIFYGMIDKKYRLTDKISAKINIAKSWQPVAVVLISFAFIVILGIAGIYFIDISTNVYFLFSGLIAGVAIAFATEIQRQIRNKR